MKILIIGNLGYVGPCVIEHFHQAVPKAELYGYDIGFFQGHITHSRGLLPESYLKAQYFGDVRTFDAKCLEGMDAVIYLAAISNDPMGKEFEKPTHDINELAAVNVASAAKKAGVSSFVFASSCSVYGLADQAARTEDSEVNPLTAYARSKINTEKKLKGLESDKFRITCLRFATACGISHRLRLDLVLNDFVASAIVNKKIEILSDGKPWRPLINVKDMARAMEWAVSRSGDAFLIVNAGSNEWNYQVLDLAKAVQKELPGTEISVNRNAPPDNRSYKVDFSKFEKLAPGFYPKLDLGTTIRELADGLTSIGFNNPDFRNSQMIRLKSLQNLIQARIIDKELRLI